MLSKIANRSALLPAAVVVALSLVLSFGYPQPVVERNRLMLAWLRLALLSEEPHRFYQMPLADATKSKFTVLAGRLGALCDASPEQSGAVCWRAQMARLIAAGADERDRPVQPGHRPGDAPRQEMLADVAGDLAYAEGRRDAAIEVWLAYLPASAIIYKAEAVLAQGDEDVAVRLLDGLKIERFPQPEGAHLAQVLVELGKLSLDRRQFAEAESYWRWAIIQSPERDTYYVGLGRALAGQQRWGEAAMAYQRAIRLAPDKAQHYLRLARVLIQAGEAEEALLALQRAGELEPDNAAVRRLLDRLGQK
ncbi:MAG TPA: tetratricopeptide repeat protein [Anaerolineae bacterium]